MKKIILAVALLAGMTFVACSNDDDKNGNCVTCRVQGQSAEICKGDNGNAFVGGQDSEMSYDDYVDLIESTGADCN